MLDSTCKFYGLSSEAIDAAQRHTCLHLLIKFGLVNISSLFAINEVAYHRRMDILTSMGMMVLLSFVSWHLTLLVDLMSMVRINRTNIFLSLLRQGGFDHMAQSGSLSLVDPGYSCILSLCTDITYVGVCLHACVYISNVYVLSDLRSRGSTHRSYWRASGHGCLKKSHSWLIRVCAWHLFYSLHCQFLFHGGVVQEILNIPECEQRIGYAGESVTCLLPAKTSWKLSFNKVFDSVERTCIWLHLGVTRHALSLRSTLHLYLKLR